LRVCLRAGAGSLVQLSRVPGLSWTSDLRRRFTLLLLSKCTYVEDLSGTEWD
jgi:hypothetical protein